MDDSKTPALDPKLKEAYDRVMGVSTTPIVQDAPPASNDGVTTSPQFSATQPTLPQREPVAMPSSQMNEQPPVQNSPMTSLPEEHSDVMSPAALPPMPPLDDAISQTAQQVSSSADQTIKPEATVEEPAHEQIPEIPEATSEETMPIHEDTTTPSFSPMSTPSPVMPEHSQMTTNDMSSGVSSPSMSHTMSEPVISNDVPTPAIPPQMNPEAVISSSYLPQATAESMPVTQTVEPMVTPAFSSAVPSPEPQISFTQPVNPPISAAPVSPPFPSVVTPMQYPMGSSVSPMPSTVTATPVVPTPSATQPMKKQASSLKKRLIIGGVAIVFMIAYAFIWIKVLGLPIPGLG